MQDSVCFHKLCPPSPYSSKHKIHSLCHILTVPAKILGEVIGYYISYICVSTLLMHSDQIQSVV